MSKKTFQIISGITTIIGTAAVSIVNLLNTPKAALISGIIVALTGCIDEICTLFINDDSTKVEKKD